MYDFRKLASLKHLCACCIVLFGLGNSVSVIAATKPNFQNTGIRVTGNSAQIGMGGNTANGVAAFPTYGNVNPVSNSGWYTAGNYGVAPAASGQTLNMAITGDVAFSGVKYPWQAAYAVPKSNIWAGVKGLMGAASGGPVGLALFSAPFLLDWLTSSGGRVNPTTGEIERKDPTYCTVAPCYEHSLGSNGPWFSQPKAAIDNAFPTCFNYTSAETPPANWYSYVPSGTPLNSPLMTTCPARQGAFFRRSVAPSQTVWLPSSMNDIEPYMTASGTKPDGRVIQELLDKGADITIPAPTVTGPASVVGSETTTVNPDGTKSVSKTTYNFTNSGDKITNTSNVTTTNNYNTSNVITGTTTTTATPVAAESKPSECEKNPQSNGCRTDEFDTPIQEIPKSTRNVTFNAENLGFAGGSCPGDKFMSPHGMAAPIKVYDWAGTCDKVTTYAKPMILALATFAALMIIFVGKPE